MVKSVVLITLFSLLNLSEVLACNCSPMLEVSNLERRVDISDIFLKGKIIDVHVDSIPYKSIKVTYQIQNWFKGDLEKSKTISIYYPNVAIFSCGVSLNDFKIGKLTFITARRFKANSEPTSYLEANYCDLSNEVSSYDPELLNGYLKKFTTRNNDMPITD